MGYSNYYSQIPQLYEEIKGKVFKIEKILNIIFLQELQIVSDKNGCIKDIILLCGDIEGFSYKSKNRLIFEIKIFSKVFDFPSCQETILFMTKLLDQNFSRGLDQYFGISLLTHRVVSYYGIIGGIRPEYGTININFYENAIDRLEELFPDYDFFSNFKPLGSILLKFDGSIIMDKIVYSYEPNSLLFKKNAIKQLEEINDIHIKSYLDVFSKLSFRDYYKEYISWSGISMETGEKFFLSEFFLKSKKRSRILTTLENGFDNDFLEAYLCEISDDKKYIKTWFLVKDSYYKRKQKGLYKHQEL